VQIFNFPIVREIDVKLAYRHQTTHEKVAGNNFSAIYNCHLPIVIVRGKEPMFQSVQQQQTLTVTASGHD